MIPIVLELEGYGSLDIQLPQVPRVGDVIRLAGHDPIAVYSVDWHPDGIEGREAHVAIFATY